MLLALVASSSASAIVASGGINISDEPHWDSSTFKLLIRQGDQEPITMLEPFIVIEEDRETGLLYAKARFYDPDAGIFLSEGAFEGDEMIAPSLHRYIYVYQNPTVFIDLDGNQATPIVFGQISSPRVTDSKQFGQTVDTGNILKDIRIAGAQTVANAFISLGNDSKNLVANTGEAIESSVSTVAKEGR